MILNISIDMKTIIQQGDKQGGRAESMCVLDLLPSQGSCDG